MLSGTQMKIQKVRFEFVCSHWVASRTCENRSENWARTAWVVNLLFSDDTRADSHLIAPNTYTTNTNLGTLNTNTTNLETIACIVHLVFSEDTSATKNSASTHSRAPYENSQSSISSIQFEPYFHQVNFDWYVISWKKVVATCVWNNLHWSYISPLNFLPFLWTSSL